jgi:iron complex outermembrane receptor protein
MVFSGLTLWSSYSYQPYRFESYEQSGVDFSGKELTGVPRNIWVSGLDMDTKTGIYFNASLNATSSLPLNDAKCVCRQVSIIAGKTWLPLEEYKSSFDIFFGVDNLLNQSYSLGNDINALGNRYYNAAAGRNVFAGIICRF